MKYMRAILLAILMTHGPALFYASAATVTIGAKEWFQPTAFGGLSWNAIATSLDNSPTAPEGQLTGFIRGLDMTGAIWASQEDLFHLINHFATTPLTAISDFKNQGDSTWMPSHAGGTPSTVFSGFLPTDVDDSRLTVSGWVRTSNPGFSSYAYSPQVTNDDGDADTASTWSFVTKGTTFAGRGAWIYRSVAVVPIPGSFMLMGSGLLGLFILRKKFSRKVESAQD